MSFATADLCDAHPDTVRVLAPMLRHFGRQRAFSGPIATLKIYEDNALVRQALSAPGQGRVLVVDAGGSLRRAVVGDQLAALAQAKGWTGIVVYGCIRDAKVIGETPLGVMALATHPLKSDKKGVGDVEVPVTFGGVIFVPGHFLYADEDGVIVSAQPLQ